MISEFSDVGLAFGPANVVGWAHVRWEETQDVDEPNLSFYQFMWFFLYGIRDFVTGQKI